MAVTPPVSPRDHSGNPGPTAQPTFTRVVTLARCGSTNHELLTRRGAQPQAWPHGSVLRAIDQHAGRGRLDRTWVTPADQALTASVLLEPRRPLQEWPTLSLVAALAVVRALRGRGLDAAVKWPNDVIVRSDDWTPLPGWGRTRKVAGLLAQAAPPHPDASPALILGIGVNCEQRDLPVRWATSLVECGSPVRPATLLGLIGAHLAPLVETWQEAGLTALLPEVSAVMDTLSRRVEAVEAVEAAEATDATGACVPVVGEALALDESGGLVLALADGTRLVLRSGEVRAVRRADGA